MNKHRFRMLFENIIIIFLFLTVIYYIITFILSLFSDVKIKLPSIDFNISIPTINTNFLLDKFTKETNISIQKENNITLKKEENNDSNLYEISIKKITTELNITKEKEPVSIVIETKKEKIHQKTVKSSEKKEIIKKIIIKKEEKTSAKRDIIPTAIKKEISKEEMLKSLRIYIKNTIINVRENANKLENLSKDKSSIKIRITVFKSGKYRKITYMSGNKELMNEAKIALNKSFPNKPDNIIKSQFPRYLRFKINFKDNQKN